MLTQHRQYTNRGRYAALVSVVILGIVTLLGSGGGDGGTTSTPGDKPGLLSSYDMVIAGASEDGIAAPGITVSFNDATTTHTLRVNPTKTGGAGLFATLTCNVTTQECGLTSLNTDTAVEVFDVSGTMFGNFTIRVLQDVLLSDDENSLAGVIQVNAGSGSSAKTIKLTYKNCGSTPGVELLLNDTVVLGCYSSADFENLIDTSEDVNEQLASLAFQIISFLFEQTEYVTSTFDLIDDNLAQAGGSIDQMCDAFSGVGLTPPSGVADQGMSTITWLDDNADSSVGPGDSISLNLTDCWNNNNDDTVDELLNGGINLIAYTLVKNADNVINRIGFEGSTAGKVGGVFYDGFMLRETKTIGSSTSIDSTLNLSGGFTIVFSAP